MNAPTESSKFAIQQLNEGEIYAGAIIQPDGTGHHIILLADDFDDCTWDDAMELAKSVGGDLPDRVEQSLLYKHLNEKFKKEWYWSNTQHAATLTVPGIRSSTTVTSTTTTRVSSSGLVPSADQ